MTPRVSTSLDFAEAIEHLLLHLAVERGLSENYQKLTERSLSKFAEFVAANYPDKSVCTLQREQLTDYLKVEYARGMAPAIVKCKETLQALARDPAPTRAGAPLILLSLTIAYAFQS